MHRARYMGICTQGQLHAHPFLSCGSGGGEGALQAGRLCLLLGGAHQLLIASTPAIRLPSQAPVGPLQLCHARLQPRILLLQFCRLHTPTWISACRCWCSRHQGNMQVHFQPFQTPLYSAADTEVVLTPARAFCHCTLPGHELHIGAWFYSKACMEGMKQCSMRDRKKVSVAQHMRAAGGWHLSSNCLPLFGTLLPHPPRRKPVCHSPAQQPTACSQRGCSMTSQM